MEEKESAGTAPPPVEREGSTRYRLLQTQRRHGPVSASYPHVSMAVTPPPHICARVYVHACVIAYMCVYARQSAHASIVYANGRG
mmetsp:Transcript_19090/g.48847  ORF Transcript_19090/g.48847 Transcript_19090/m.48847 type:complete len:85 (-) Transcript_19090:649-903(-)